MFTGLIEEIGIVSSVISTGGGKRIAVESGVAVEDLKIGDSVALNGVCLTVVTVKKKQFEVEAVEETLRKTSLAKIFNGKKINVERALKVGDRLGGHFVQGHVDTVGNIISVQTESSDKLFKISYSSEYSTLIVSQGSICIDGVSLTVARRENSNFTVAVIPHTLKTTAFSQLRQSEVVNLEFDIIGKYVENILKPYSKESATFTVDNFNQHI